jgi:hypothetical protein
VTIRPAVPLSARLADPVPVGLAGFGLTTFMLSMINVGAVSKTALPVVLGSALAYGGILQLLAGMWAFVRQNTFAAVALSSYGAFWISYWALNTFYLSKIPAHEQAAATSLFLFAWGFFTFYMWIVSFKVNGAVVAVLGTLWPAYLCLGLGTVDATPWLIHLGGAFGIATAICAWYVSFADTLGATVGRPVLPLKPLSQKVVDQPAHALREYEPVAGASVR